jgi:hypothetical protein
MLIEPIQNCSAKSYHPSQKEDYQSRTPSPETNPENNHLAALLLVEEPGHYHDAFQESSSEEFEK